MKDKDSLYASLHFGGSLEVHLFIDLGDGIFSAAAMQDSEEISAYDGDKIATMESSGIGSDLVQRLSGSARFS